MLLGFKPQVGRGSASADALAIVVMLADKISLFSQEGAIVQNSDDRHDFSSQYKPLIRLPKKCDNPLRVNEKVVFLI